MRSDSATKQFIYTGVAILFLGNLACADPARKMKVLDVPPTILMDGHILAKSKQRLQAGDAALKPALDKLIEKADLALSQGSFSVTDKTRLPPSGDKHDYASYARYWWPDPAQPDGLPYIKRDGETNPKSMDSTSTDRYRMDLLVLNMETLGLAYSLTREERYAEKAVELIRIWFLDPDTRMNPNLTFSQGIPGVRTGSKHGIIDGRILCRALDGALLISDSPAFSASDMKALRAWASDYLDWLKTSEAAMAASKTLNNHAIFFDVQIMYFALFCGDTGFAGKIAKESLEKRILKQIEPDGSMPRELARTRSLHYSIFAVQALFELARLAEQVDVDLWHAEDSRIKAALDFIAPYSDPARTWPKQDIKEAKRMDLLWPLLYAAHAYNDNAYKLLAEKLPAAEREARRENLVVPLMR